MYRFALRPRWLAGHALALAAVIAFVAFGLWQLRRLDERREVNAAVEAVADAPPVAVDDAADAAGLDEWQLVEATGTYVPDEEVLVRSRARNGAPGFHVLTPLRLGDGAGLVVMRGWVSTGAVDDGRIVEGSPPAGEVEITGRVRPTQVRRGIGARDPDEGVLDVVSRVDVERLDRQTDLDLLPFFVELVGDVPVGGAAGIAEPIPLDPPVLDDGPHLGYAVQWFLFAAVVTVGYPLVLRRMAIHGDETSPDDDAGPHLSPGRPGSDGDGAGDGGSFGWGAADRDVAAVGHRSFGAGTSRRGDDRTAT